MPWTVKPQLEYRRLGNEGILFDPQSGRFYRLSEEMALAWEAVSRGEQPQDLEALQELQCYKLITSEGTLMMDAPPTSRNLGIEVYVFAATGCSTNKSKGTCKNPCTWDATKKVCY